MMYTIAYINKLLVNSLLRTGAYVKVLFWTDAGNILGLLPPSGLDRRMFGS